MGWIGLVEQEDLRLIQAFLRNIILVASGYTRTTWKKLFLDRCEDRHLKVKLKHYPEIHLYKDSEATGRLRRHCLGSNPWLTRCGSLNL